VPPRSLLILWDVDFTLVDAGGLGRELYRLAFLATFGSEPPESSWPKMAGRTDRAIVTEMLRLAGVPEPRRRAGEFIAAMVLAAPGLADLARERVRALPGAAAAVAAVAGLPCRPVQSLLTGNIRPLAELKMAATGLGRSLDLDSGAYGDAHEIRADLVHLARRAAAARYHHDFAGPATVLVGDTPRDVEAALATGARPVAVATGGFSGRQLADAGAHAVLPDLRDTGQAMAAILGVREITPQRAGRRDR
jgi:phosphoglycolate phosphatase